VVADALLHHSGRGTPPDEAMPDGDNSPFFYCFNFLTHRDDCRVITVD
jgi:hypothetical protein